MQVSQRSQHVDSDVEERIDPRRLEFRSKLARMSGKGDEDGACVFERGCGGRRPLGIDRIGGADHRDGGACVFEGCRSFDR